MSKMLISSDDVAEVLNFIHQTGFDFNSGIGILNRKLTAALVNAEDREARAKRVKPEVSVRSSKQEATEMSFVCSGKGYDWEQRYLGLPENRRLSMDPLWFSYQYKGLSETMPNKIALIKGLRAMFDISLRDAKNMSDNPGGWSCNELVRNYLGECGGSFMYQSL